MLKIKRFKKKQIEGINIAPLIDIIFILLLFFIVSTQFNKDGALDINKPQASTAIDNSKAAITVFITAGEQLYIDNHKTELIVLSSILNKKLSGVSDKSISISADKNVSTGFLIAVIDQCKISGFENIKINTIKN